jgi:hypothetical protein
MQYDRTVLGYHGCDAMVAERVLAGHAFVSSANDYDWLGRGVYFWEHGPDRALRFAQDQLRRGKVSEPVVVGALLQLGTCLDILDTRHTARLAEGYHLWAGLRRASGLPLPKNTGSPPYYKLRRLDAALLNWFLDHLGQHGVAFDSVRGAFAEGDPICPGSGIYQEHHIQIAVRNPACILGVFRPTVFGATRTQP